MAYGGVTPISPCAFMVTAGSCWTGARAGAWKARGAATRKAMIRDGRENKNLLSASEISFLMRKVSS